MTFKYAFYRFTRFLSASLVLRLEHDTLKEGQAPVELGVSFSH